MKNVNDIIPAKVKYNGKATKRFTPGRIYDAYLVEYWQGVRNSLHVKGNDDKITDFNSLEDFEIVEDIDDVLNLNEAIVECITHDFDNESFCIKYGQQYKAIGMDREGLYLVMDDSFDCRFYRAECFKIIDDKHEILKSKSIYYSYR